MTPRSEFSDLLTRFRRLIDVALLLVITFSLLIVAAGTLFCTVFVTTFHTGTGILDRAAVRATREKGAVVNVL